MKIYNIAIAADHTGYKIKQKIILYLNEKNISVKDLGSFNEERVDYPDYAEKVVEFMSGNSSTFGILICGTGIGMSIAANRRSNIRAALCYSETTASLARAHNDANVLVIGSQIVEELIVLKIIDIFLNTKFEGGRHSVRVQKLN